MNFRKNSHTWVSLWINKIRFQSWSNWYFSLKLHRWFQCVGRIKGHWNKGGKWHFSLSLCNCSHFCISNINPSINSLTHTSCIYLFILSFIQLVNYSSSTNSLSHLFFFFFFLKIFTDSASQSCSQYRNACQVPQFCASGDREVNMTG